MESYKQTLGLRETLAQQIYEIENRKVIQAHLSKIDKLSNEPLDLKIERVVKRQNSYAPKLEFFGDALDRMSHREGLARQNMS